MTRLSSLHLLTAVTVFTLAALTACQWKPWQNASPAEHHVTVQRFDRIESLYLTTGDFSALQHLNLSFPMQTRTLIEDILKIGQVDERDINSTFLNFYQDTTLQTLIAETQLQYAQMDDIDSELSAAFARLQQWFPSLEVPLIYAQIGALDQSIVVSNGAVGVSLEKYLGKDYPLYKRYGYSPQHLQTMGRDFVVPDILSFYLLSLYPLSNFEESTQQERDEHMAKIQWVVNCALSRQVFKSVFIDRVEKYMKQYKHTPMPELLTSVHLLSTK